jgi:hypothetical protein
MKKIIISFGLVLLYQVTFAQFETTIPFSETEDSSIFNIQLVNNYENNFTISLNGKQFNEGVDDRFIEGSSSTFSGFCELQKDEHTIHSKKIVNYPFTPLHIEQSSNFVFAIGEVENTKTQSIGNVQMNTQCKNLVIAKSDLEGVNYLSYIEPNCDFNHLYSSSFYEGNYYVLYLAKEQRYLIKLSDSLTLISKSEINETIIEANPSPIGDKFIVTIADNDNWESQKKSNLHLDGTVDDLSNFFSFPVENRNSAPKSILDTENGWIYGYTASENAKENMIYKYSLEGELIDKYTIGHKYLGWIVTDGQLIVISQTYHDEDDSKPLNITVFNKNFSPVKNLDFGKPLLIVTDVYLNNEFNEYLISGFLDTHFGDETVERKVSKMYFLQGSLNQLLAYKVEGNSSFYYPNPTNNSKVYLKINSLILPESQKNIEIVFIDISGEKFGASANFINNDLIKIDVSNLPKGIYVGTLQQNGKQIISSKLIVK